MAETGPLSSVWMWIYKLSFGVGVPVLLLAAVLAAVRSSSPFWPLPSVLCAVFAPFCYVTLRLKWVVAEESGLRVRGFWKTIFVPYAELSGVGENTRLARPRLVAIFLRRPSLFGDKILTIPKLSASAPWKTDPVVDFLRSRIASNHPG